MSGRDDFSLLSIVRSHEAYNRLKPLLSLVRIVRSEDFGPVYNNLPAASYARNAYDSNALSLGRDVKTWLLWSCFVHDCLVGTYAAIAQTKLSYLTSGWLIDQRANDRFYSALIPYAPASETTSRAWDRNSLKLFPRGTVSPYENVSTAWQENDFQRLIPLVTDYKREGRNSVVNELGVNLDDNVLTILEYLYVYASSAAKLRSRVDQVAKLTVLKGSLVKLRQQLIDRIASKQSRGLFTLSGPSVKQTQVLARLNATFNRLIDEAVKSI